MYSLKCIFLLFLVYSKCSARKKNSGLDEIEGPWVVRNASENALPLIGDCMTVDIEPPSKKSENNEAIVTLKTISTTQTLQLVSIDQITYEVYAPFLLGNVTLLKVEKHTFLVAQVETYDEVYFAVLTNENVSKDVDKKIEKFWKSSKPTKQIPLHPTERKDCDVPKDKNVAKTSGSLSISGVLIDGILISDEMMQDSPQDLPPNSLDSTGSSNPIGLGGEPLPQPEIIETHNILNGEIFVPEIKEIFDPLMTLLKEESNSTEDYGNITTTPSLSIIAVPSSLLIIGSLFVISKL